MIRLAPLSTALAISRAARAISSGGATPDYYVSNAGSDSNAGTLAAPFSTLAKAQTMLAAGKKIGLACGSTWREKLAITFDYVQVMSYGTGAKPVVNCCDVINAGQWTKTGGRTNIYQVSLTVEPDAAAAELPSIWISGVRMPAVADLATLDATPGAYYYNPATDGLTVVVIYVHPPGSTNPIVDTLLYEGSVRATGIDTYSAQFCTITNIAAKRNYASYGSIVLGRNCTASDCTVTEGNRHNMFLRAGARAINCTATDAYAYGEAPTLFVAYEDAPPGGSTALFSGCTASSTVYADLLGFYGHTSGTDWASMTFSNCTVNNCSVPFAAANATSCVITGGAATNFATAYKFATDLTVTGAALSLPRPGGAIAVVDGPSVTQVFDTITVNFGTSGPIQSNQSNTSVTLRNSTIQAINSLFIGGGAATGQSWTSRNNVFIPDGRVYDGYYLQNATATIDADYNTYAGSIGNSLVAGVSYATFALFAAGTGQDAHSTF